MKIPIELIHSIVDGVTETSDLISLGLTSKYFAAIVFPNYILYHTICVWEQHDLWTYLVQNPKICRYIRRLKVEKFEIKDNPKKMRLTHFDVDLTDDEYKKPEKMPPLLWSYELIGRALRQMVNLKAFEWSPPETPVFDAESNMAKSYSNLHTLKPVHAWLNLSSLPKNHPYVSMFDTPVMHSVCGLVSLTLVSLPDVFDYSSSIMNFLMMCHQLEYLELDIFGQAFAGEFVSRGRWPNLRTLSLSISQDPSKATATEESLGDFINFHSNIVSLGWHIGFGSNTGLMEPRGKPLSITSLPLGSLPRLQALDADENLVRSLIACPCDPPRSLRKIIDFPTDVEIWKHPDTNFQGINKSALKIVNLGPMESLRQLSEFGTLFPNIECIDFRMILDIFPRGWKQSRMSHLADLVRSLSTMRNLKIIIGLQFWEEDLDENWGLAYRTEDKIRHNINARIFDYLDATLPRLELCVVHFSVIKRVGPSRRWKWVWVSQGEIYSERKHDLTIPEEHDLLVS